MTTSPSPRRRFSLAFLPVVLALFWAASRTDSGASGARLFGITLVCGATGVLWQLGYRRDLADRLTHFASLFTVAALVLFLPGWHAQVTSSLGFGVGAGAVLTGLVYTEQALRTRDLRALSTESMRRYRSRR